MRYSLHLAALALAAAALGAPAVAQAQPYPATTAVTAHLRAGPSRDYPVVAILPADYPITVEGCVPSYTWCDVIAGPDRGWVYAGNINYLYQGAYVPVLNYGELVGITVFGFVFSDYWHDHYFDRPWYGQRQRWINVPPPGLRPRYGPHNPGVAPYPYSGSRPRLGPDGGGRTGPGPRPGVAPQPRVQPTPQPRMQPGAQPRMQPGAQPPSRPAPQQGGGQGGRDHR